MFSFFQETKPVSVPQRQTMRGDKGFYITNQTIINVAPGANVQLTALPPAAQGDPRSPRVSISTTCLDVATPLEVKPQPTAPKKCFGLC